MHADISYVLMADICIQQLFFFEMPPKLSLCSLHITVRSYFLGVSPTANGHRIEPEKQPSILFRRTAAHAGLAYNCVYPQMQLYGFVTIGNLRIKKIDISEKLGNSKKSAVVLAISIFFNGAANK